MPKAIPPVAEAGQARRHRPLEEDLLTTGLLRNTPGKRKLRNEDDSQDKFVGSKASKKILRIGQELADEDRDEQAAAKLNTAFGFEPRISDAVSEDVYEDDEAWGDEEEEIVQEADLAPSDLEIFSKFFPTEEDPLLRQGWGGTVTAETEEQQGTNLAEIILEKIAAHEAAQADTKSAEHGLTGAPDVDYELHPKVVDVYTKYV
jgi:essential nuclear protein 1